MSSWSLGQIAKVRVTCDGSCCRANFAAIVCHQDAQLVLVAPIQLLCSIAYAIVSHKTITTTATGTATIIYANLSAQNIGKTC